MKRSVTRATLQRSKNVTPNARKSKEEGALFVRYFGPLLDALGGLGGSGTPAEVVERIAERAPEEVKLLIKRCGCAENSGIPKKNTSQSGVR